MSPIPVKITGNYSHHYQSSYLWVDTIELNNKPMAVIISKDGSVSTQPLTNIKVISEKSNSSDYSEHYYD